MLFAQISQDQFTLNTKFYPLIKSWELYFAVSVKNIFLII